MSHNKIKKQVESEYKLYLKKIEDMMASNDTTYLSQLEKAGKQLFGVSFRGVFPSDKIPALNDLAPYCILNLDRSDEPGSHWVALCKIENRNESIFYDSFGRCHTEIMKNLKFSGNGRIKNTENDAEQKVLQNNCGQRCLAFIKMFHDYGPEVALMI